MSSPCIVLLCHLELVKLYADLPYIISLSIGANCTKFRSVFFEFIANRNIDYIVEIWNDYVISKAFN